ncbi:MAG: type IV pilin protein, partial [Methylococcales bacterium]
TQGSVVYYQLTISAVTATSYSLAATPTGLQANDKCGALTLTSVGVKDIVDEANGVTVGNCW